MPEKFIILNFKLSSVYSNTGLLNLMKDYPFFLGYDAAPLDDQITTKLTLLLIIFVPKGETIIVSAARDA